MNKLFTLTLACTLLFAMPSFSSSAFERFGSLRFLVFTASELALGVASVGVVVYATGSVLYVNYGREDMRTYHWLKFKENIGISLIAGEMAYLILNNKEGTAELVQGEDLDLNEIDLPEQILEVQGFERVEENQF